MSAAAQARAWLNPPEFMRTEWARQGMDTLAAALRIISDLTAQEVALLVGIVRERASLRPSASTVETAGRIVTGMTETGKVLLDLTAGESRVLVDTVKEMLGLGPGAGALADLVPRGVGTIVEMHKHMLDTVAEQAQDIMTSYSEGESTMPAYRMAKVTRDSIQSFIETQKTFLDQVAEQVTVATEAGEAAKPAKHDRREALVTLAREGMDKFIDAQKQIVALTIERMEPGTRHRKTEARTSLAKVARESVQNFTTAQKSLLDLALKPVAEAEKPHKRRAAHHDPIAEARAAARSAARAAARQVGSETAREEARKTARAEARKTARAAARVATRTAQEAGREAGRQAGRAAGRAAAKAAVAEVIEEE